MPSAPPVTPMKQDKTEYVQSPFDLPRIPMRLQAVGRSNSGKSTLISSIIQHQYKGVWEKIYIFSSTVNVDPMWKALTEHIQETLGQIREVKDIDGEVAVAHEKVDEVAIRRILAQSERSINRQKQEGKKKCKSTLIIFDDLSHTKELNKHAAGLMGELFTTSRHFGVSLIASVHSISSLGSLPRRQLSCLIRSEERRVGKECRLLCRSRWSPYH